MDKPQKRKTIFVTLAAGQEIRNILYGDFYRLAKERKYLRFVFFAPQEKIEKLREKFAHECCIIEPIEGIDLGWRIKQLYRIACFGCIPTITIWSRNWFSFLNGGSLGNFLMKQFFWLLGHIRPWRSLMRSVEYYFFRDDEAWRKYFEEYKPDVVFGAGLLNEEDFTMVKYAKRHGIPTVGMTRSWDNFTSKGFLRVHPDILLVQNETMVGEAGHFNSFPRDRIRVVGFPQWDHYVDSSWHISKEEFARRFGADPKKRWLVYFGGGLAAGLFNLPETGEHVVMLNRAIERGEIKNAEVLVRPHPSPYHVRALLDEAKKGPVLTFGKGWDFSDEDMKLLMNLVRLADVTMNMGSTMALEAAVFDKPIVIVGCNGYEDDSKIPWSKRLSTALNNTLHYRQVEGTGGTTRVSNERELIDAVRAYVENPALHQEGRERLRKEFVGPLDGKAGKRIFEIVTSLAESS